MHTAQSVPLRPFETGGEELTTHPLVLPRVGDGDRQLRLEASRRLHAEVSDDHGRPAWGMAKLGDQSLTMFVIRPAEPARITVGDAVADAVEPLQHGVGRQRPVEVAERRPIAGLDRPDPDRLGLASVLHVRTVPVVGGSPAVPNVTHGWADRPGWRRDSGDPLPACQCPPDLRDDCRRERDGGNDRPIAGIERRRMECLRQRRD